MSEGLKKWLQRHYQQQHKKEQKRILPEPLPSCPDDQELDEETNLCVLGEPQAADQAEEQPEDEETEQLESEEPESVSEDQESEDQE